jgi:S1-C subfamily serine protease
MNRIWRAGFCAIVGAGLVAAQAARAADRPAPSVTEQIFTAARSKLLQISTLVDGAGRPSSIGSGFLVGADGTAITNYHVVSQFALEPETYRLEYATTDGARGPARLLAVDIADDLAVIRIDKPVGDAFLRFDTKALESETTKGERLHALGNPLNLGFTVIDGTYSGAVERSYAPRIHFSGALNPGMSGGPTVTDGGLVVGINVAKQNGGELVSFLVPASFAVALLERAAHGPTTTDFKADIGRQLTAWQASFNKAFGLAGFRDSNFGPYRAPESAAPWLNCWAQTNAGHQPPSRGLINTSYCFSNSRLFIAGDLTRGDIFVSQSYIRDVDLNKFQFGAYLSTQVQSQALGANPRKWNTAERCQEAFVVMGDPATHPPLHLSWCTRAYRDLGDLYDVWVTAVTQDRDKEALVSRLTMEVVDYQTAMSLTQRFLGAITWKR